eukprot:9507929-Prorocentrum_lima.AAC.1
MKVFAIPCMCEISSGPLHCVSTEVLTSHSSASSVHVLKGYDRCMLRPQAGGILSECDVPIPGLDR